MSGPHYTGMYRTSWYRYTPRPHALMVPATVVRLSRPTERTFDTNARRAGPPRLTQELCHTRQLTMPYGLFLTLLYRTTRAE